jgi:hypothetical protein
MLLIALALAAIDPPPRPMTLEFERDSITDEISVKAELRDGPNRIEVTCDPADYRGIRVDLHTNRWLARGNMLTGERPLTYRFDDARPRRTMWDVSHRRARLEGRRRVLAFMRALAASRRLVVRTRDVEGRRYELAFRLVDTRPAVERTLEACGETLER